MDDFFWGVLFGALLVTVIAAVMFIAGGTVILSC